MKRFTHLAVISVLALAPASLIGAQEREGNAALRYWRAISLASDDIENTVRASLPPASDADWIITDAAREAAESIHQIGEIAVKASTFSTCDFGVDIEEGPGALLTHLGPMRTVARLLVVDARLLEEQGDHEGAVARLAAGFRVAGHVNADGFLIGSLVSMSVFESVDRAAGWFESEGLLNDDDRAALLASLAALQDEDPFGTRRAIDMERAAMIGWLREAAGGEGLVERLRAGFTSDEQESLPEIEAIAKAVSAGQSVEPLLTLAEQGFTHVIEHWRDEDAVEQLREIEARVNTGVYGPVGELLMPSFVRVKRNELAAIEKVSARAASLGG